jgi:hypothetical protein
MGEFHKRPLISSQSVTLHSVASQSPCTWHMHGGCSGLDGGSDARRKRAQFHLNCCVCNAQLSVFHSTGRGIIPAYAFVSCELPSASESLTKTAAGARGVAATTQHQPNRLRVRALTLARQWSCACRECDKRRGRSPKQGVYKRRCTGICNACAEPCSLPHLVTVTAGIRQLVAVCLKQIITDVRLDFGTYPITTEE